MSKKRTSHELNNDQDNNDGSGSTVFRPDDNAKRSKLAPLSHTTLQDLPIEILEYILVKAVALEVNGMKLATSVWKDKANLVIRRLQSVCLQWSNILANDFFQNELRRTLDRMAEVTIRMEILQRSPIQQYAFRMTTLKDEIFMHALGNTITVYDSNNIAEVKDVISLPGMLTVDIAACNVSNCVYVLCVNIANTCFSVSRITKTGEHQFSISPWISDLGMSPSVLSVSANASLLIISAHDTVSVYNTNGFLQHNITLPSGIYKYRSLGNVLQRTNGNLVLVACNDQRTALLTEIDMSGSIVCQYQSALGGESAVSLVDACGRIVISDPNNGIELLDSELNLLNYTGAQLNGGQFAILHSLHYNSWRNEVVSYFLQIQGGNMLSIFRFAEE